MPSKIIIKALWETLENLTGQNYEKFCHALLLQSREGERVGRIKVEGKDAQKVTDAMVSAFTDSGALEVAVQTLKDINCNQEAQRLREMTEDLGAQSSKPGSSDTAGSSAGASGATNMADDKHFVDKHQPQLIDRVSNIAPILDHLLFNEVISQEIYKKIRKLPTSEEMMRELYLGPLQASTVGKDIFFEALKKNEKFLIEDLKKCK